LGQQQLLLIVLGVIVVGIAITVGIILFRQNAIDSKRTIVTNECISLASMAISYYKKSPNFGGGGNSFTGWSVPSQLQLTASGTYTAAVYSDSVVITGTGNEVVTGSDSVKIRTSVYPDRYATQIIN
jgi:hypothetical protein